MESRKLTEADKVTTKQVLLIILAAAFALFVNFKILDLTDGKPCLRIYLTPSSPMQLLLVILAAAFALFVISQILDLIDGKPWIQIKPISDKESEKKVEKARIDNYGIVNHGNGVYFFPDDFRRGDRFGITLSAFIEEHPELELVSVTAESKNGVFGYIVVFRPKR